MIWFVIILLLIEVEGAQEEPACDIASNNLPSHDSCLDQHPATNAVCLGEVQLQNVLEAALEERCKEGEEKEEMKEGDKGKGGGEEEEGANGCLFLLETSTREVLTSREACALESAVRNSGQH